MSFIRKIRGEIVNLPLATYNGIAKPGEIVVDDSTYQTYIANSTGQLNAIGGGGGGGGGTSIVNGTSNVDIPISGGNVKVGVSGVPDVLNVSSGQFDVRANIVPVGDAVYSLGSPTAQFKDLYLSNSTLYLDLIPVGVSGNVLTVDGANVLTESPNGTSTFANLQANGNITANSLIANANVIAPNLVASANVTATQSVITDTVVGRTGALTLRSVGSDQNVNIIPTGNGTVAVNGSRISDLANPTASTDAAPKSYVDGVASGLRIKAAVAAASTTNLSGTYLNGTAGVGATFTLAVPTSFIDSYAMQLGDRILLKDQTNAIENGIYIRTTTSVFTRATDSDTATELESAYVFVQNGAVNSKSGFVQTASIATVGTSNIVFTQFSDAGDYSAGSGLTLTGSVFSITPSGVVSGTYGNTILSPTITVNDRGQITNITEVAFDKDAANLTGATLSSNVLYSSLTTLGTLTGLTVNGDSTLGSNANVIITGGTNGQILTTNGAGNLRWDNAPIDTSIANGATSVNIPVGAGNVVVTVGGAISANITADGMTAGNLTANSNITTANLTVGTKANLGAIANVIITGGTNGQILSTDGSGTLSWANPGGGTSNIANGTSNASIDTVNGDFGVSINGTANVFKVTSAGIQVTGTSDLGAVGDITITGGTSGQILSTDGAGVLSWVSAGSAGSAISNGTSNVDIATSSGDVTVGVGGVADVLKVTSTGANITGTANVSGVANLESDLNVGGVSNLGPVGNVVITGGTSGQVLSTDGAGVLSWATVSGSGALANGTSNVNIPLVNGGVIITSNASPVAVFRNDGTKDISDINGDVNFTSIGNVYFGGSAIGTQKNLVSFQYTENVNLGPVANVHIAGGTNGQVLSTDGAGVLSWTTAGGGGSIISNGTSNVTIPTSDAAVAIYSNGVNMFQLWKYNTGINDSIIEASGPFRFNGSGSSNIQFGVSGLEVGNVDFTYTNKVVFGDVADITIPGGTSGQVLTTDGSGVLSWTTVGSGALANGTSSVTIPTVDGTVEVTSDGDSVASFWSSGGTRNVVLHGEITLTGYSGGGEVLRVGVNGNEYDLADFQYVANVNLPTVANIHIAGGNNGEVLKTGGSGLLSWGHPSKLANGSTDIDIPADDGNIIVTGNLLPSANVTYNLGSATQRWNSIYLANNTIYLGDTPVSVGANNTLTVGNVEVVTQDPSGETEIQGNIIAPGEITANGNITTNGNLITTGNLVVSGVSDLGAVGNIIITGGISGQVLTTDGSGNLSWTTGGGGGGGGTSISNGNASISAFDAGGIEIVANTFVSVSFTGDSDGSNRVSRFNGTLKVANSGVGFPGTVDFTEAANVSLGAVGNLHIDGGSNGQVLTTDGSGALSWTTVSGGGGSGNAITTDSGNVAVSVSKDANGNFYANTTFYDSYAAETKTLISAFGYNDSANSVYNPVILFGEVEVTPPNPPVFKTVNLTIFGNLSVSQGNSVFVNSNTVSLSSSNLQLNNSKWPSGYGTNNQVLTTDGTGNLSWSTAGGGSSTYINNGNSYVWIPDSDGYATVQIYKDSNDGVHSWLFNRNGNLELPPVANNKMSISGTSRLIYADPHPAQDTGTFTVWTGTGSSVCGAKMTLRAKNTSTGHIQMMDILMVKDINNSNSSYTVSNRVKTNSAETDIGIIVDVNSSRLRLQAVCGATTYNFTYTVDEFQTL